MQTEKQPKYTTAKISIRHVLLFDTNYFPFKSITACYISTFLKLHTLGLLFVSTHVTCTPILTDHFKNFR